ncbi:MAG TPA: ferritin-like domain-containing protein [Polyangiales bacterium]
MSNQRPQIAAIKKRKLEFRNTDASALRTLAQAAINVELFTIPLYMGTLYSIQGMHEINAAGQTFYKGRRWPGASTTRAPGTANERAFNTIFSVFIQEMLHLQLISNIASCVGQRPDFTSDALQNERHGWICYGPEQHMIPHIIDLRDTTTYAEVKTDIAPLDKRQIQLFLAIEEPEPQAVARIRPDKLSKYFPSVPFKDWNTTKTESDLPLFGTIGYMYECMVAYMTLEYEDGTSLWDYVFSAGAVQRELFNTPSGGHPMAEYPGFPTLVPTSSGSEALSGAIDMICAITDQGEGSKVGEHVRAMLAARQRAATINALNRVETDYRSSNKALKLDYPSYDADGKPVPSADAEARFKADGHDHYERFMSLAKEIHDVVTWREWHQARGAAPWTANDLLTGGSDAASSKIPSAQDVAGALNRLKAKNADGSVHTQLSQVAAGAIYGITRVLNNYWEDASVSFPFPAMGGSGDRMAICWAALGQAPNLRLGIEKPAPQPYYHGCQGLNLDQPGADVMPARATYHTCIGSNECKGQGGCGFVQKLSGGGSCGGGGGGCSQSVATGKGIGAHLAAQAGCGQTLYSAPANNACESFGGCAVPISASQLFPKSGAMQVFDITQQGNPKLAPIPFEVGDPVYTTAWNAYVAVLTSKGVKPPAAPPTPDDLRVALPPST